MSGLVSTGKKMGWGKSNANYRDNIFVKEVYPQCASLTWGLTLGYEMAIDKVISTYYITIE